MDWRELYREYDYDRIAYLGGERMPEFLERFFDRVGVPASVLSVGCGPAVTEFAIAERYPDTAVHGVDVSPALVADNRAEATARGLENLTFGVDALPALETDGEYALVYCVATLFFVPAVEAALGALWARVAPGGHLVVTYADDATREWAADMPERRRAFFEPVLDGRAVHTRGEIEAALGTTVADYWAAVDADGEYTDYAPTVYAHKDG